GNRPILMKNLDNLYQEALALLQKLSTEDGILASAIKSDNYKRIWARDSVLAGIAGILSDNHLIIKGLKASLLSLSKHQHPLGMIPSNVEVGKTDPDVSYGSLIGRIDTNTWFIIGSTLYYKHTSDKEFWDRIQVSLKNSLKFLQTIEFNGKGWIYTPMSGNWADEYPVHGYTLYDNTLYLWAKSLLVSEGVVPSYNLPFFKEKTFINFWPKANAEQSNIYQVPGYAKVLEIKPSHFCAFIQPGCYDTRFDAAANGLACLIFNLEKKQKKRLENFLDELKSSIGEYVLPAFWPVLTEESWDWNLLRGNYSYNFKNTPYNFHNGGIWPIWTGLFCLGLAKQGLMDKVELLTTDFVKIVNTQNWNFQEFINSQSLELAGKEKMAYTATGIVFMKHALEMEDATIKLGL
ncbi:MAG: glycoside hydrolase 100 family protein, partial [Flavobacteriaceae bacterium]|nr:glycoside hydrolase 100 family protein [Flavobacteriaceae bacterium]